MSIAVSITRIPVTEPAKSVWILAAIVGLMMPGHMVILPERCSHIDAFVIKPCDNAVNLCTIIHFSKYIRMHMLFTQFIHMLMIVVHIFNLLTNQPIHMPMGW